MRSDPNVILIKETTENAVVNAKKPDTSVVGDFAFATDVLKYISEKIHKIEKRAPSLVSHFLGNNGVIAVTQGSVKLFDVVVCNTLVKRYDTLHACAYTKKMIPGTPGYSPVIIFDSRQFHPLASGLENANLLAHELGHCLDDEHPKTNTMTSTYSTSKDFKDLLKRNQDNDSIKEIRRVVEDCYHERDHLPEIFARLVEIKIEAPLRLPKSMRDYFKNAFFNDVKQRQ